MWLNMVDAGTTVVGGFAARAIHATGGSDDVAYSIAPTNNNVPDLNNKIFKKKMAVADFIFLL